MSAMILGPDPWTLAEEADRRFRKITANIGIPVLIFALILPWLNLQTETEKEEPPAFVEVLQEPPPEPKPEPKPEEPPKPVENAAKPQQAPAQPKPAPVEHNAPAAPTRSAREVAEQSGLMKFRDQLADMSNQNLSTAINQRLSDPSVLTSQASGERVAASAAAASSGIGGGSSSVTGTQGGTGLGTRRTGAVQSAIGNGRENSAGRGDGRPGAARSLQEIQLAFDRSKTAFFAIFNRAARESGIGAGRIVVSLTIAPDGSVTRCELVSSSFSDPELQQKILQRVRLLNFGAKDVPPFTYPNYPIDFLPS